MGNSVSADNQVHLTNIENKNNPPPECPMHKSEKAQEGGKRPSECPIQHGKDDVNPYNMVKRNIISDHIVGKLFLQGNLTFNEFSHHWLIAMFIMK